MNIPLSPTGGGARWETSNSSRYIYIYSFVFFWRDSPQWGRAFSLSKFLDHTQRRTTVGRTALDKLSARRIDLYLTTHNTHKRQTSMPPVGFEPTVSAGNRQQTYTLDRAAPKTGGIYSKLSKISPERQIYNLGTFHRDALYLRNKD